jgi:hypothetical protein
MADGPDTLKGLLEAYGTLIAVGGIGGLAGLTVGYFLGYIKGANSNVDKLQQGTYKPYQPEEQTETYEEDDDGLPIYTSRTISSAERSELESELEVTVKGLSTSDNEISCTIADATGEALFYMRTEDTERYQQSGILKALFESASLSGKPLKIGVIYDSEDPVFLGDYVLFNEGRDRVDANASNLL